jgi:hypothetical protein
MSELISRLAAEGEIVRAIDGSLTIANRRAEKIISHYEREITLGRMSVNTAVNCVKSNYSGSNDINKIRG